MVSGAIFGDLLTAGVKEGAEAAAKAAAKEAAEAAAKAAAKEAAEAALEAGAKEGVQAAGKKAAAAAAKAAKVAAAKAIKQAALAFDDVVSAGAKATAKGTDDLAAQAVKAVKNAVKGGSDDALAVVAKGSDDVAEATAKEAKGAVDDLIGGAKKAGSQTAKEGDAVKETFWKKYGGKAFAGVAAASIATAAGITFGIRNNQKVNITKIEVLGAGALGRTGTTALITYDPPLRIMPTDRLTISGTDCSPSLDGKSVSVVSTKGRDAVVVAAALTAGGTTGQLVLHTTMQAQLVGAMVDVASPVVQAGASVIGEAVEQGADAAGLPTFEEIATQLKAWAMYIGISLLVLALLRLLIMFYQARGRRPAAVHLVPS